MLSTALTEEELRKARAWVEEYLGDELSPNQSVDRISDRQIQQGIERYYEGGIKQFKKDVGV